MAQENRTWGYDRIQGAIANLGHDLSPSGIAKILKRHGIEPAPGRVKKTTWKEFLKRHADQIAATDFLTIEVWTMKGLQRFITGDTTGSIKRTERLDGMLRYYARCGITPPSSESPHRKVALSSIARQILARFQINAAFAAPEVSPES